MSTKNRARLVAWVASPEPDRLVEILKELNSYDLLTMMTWSGAVGRIAWAEYGRRMGHADFVLYESVLDGSLHVTFEAEAKPVHYTPIFNFKSAI